VPDATSLDLSAAVALLETAGYEPVLRWDELADAAPGTAVAMDPVPGTTLTQGMRITLTIAGPEPGTDVPRVLGETADEALTHLRSLGLQVQIYVRAEGDVVPPARRGKVWAQYPPDGFPVDGPVIIWVNPDPQAEDPAIP
jgi:beta-lactam-binding protein with PASTA domain